VEGLCYKYGGLECFKELYRPHRKGADGQSLYTHLDSFQGLTETLFELGQDRHKQQDLQHSRFSRAGKVHLCFQRLPPG
jgi:hypothetical protein